ncbi:MAG: phosphoribosylaminoimidazolesuccinocarboxamide synthase [Actinomycetota bacterium]|nr:phosphoribosylaminoimidazolesuccinocarboxamide synthase [Actinomycetota bacterium]
MTTVSPIYSGKVRDIYDAGDDRLLMVASDRISAFDVVMAEPVPEKGKVLTRLSAFWFAKVADLIPSHLISTDPAQFGELAEALPDIDGRAMLVRRAEMLPVECIVRGWLSGSGWKDYQRTGAVSGVTLPEGLRQSERLPEPIFTPSTKATDGHDENITFDEAAALVGDDVMREAAAVSIALYQRAAELAATKGLIIADTKFELGFLDGRLALCDEALTPDSSRFWEADAVEPGKTPPSFDKQPVRDWLEQSGWDKSPPPPTLPDEVIEATRDRYVAAYERLTGSRYQ